MILSDDGISTVCWLCSKGPTALPRGTPQWMGKIFVSISDLNIRVSEQRVIDYIIRRQFFCFCSSPKCHTLSTVCSICRNAPKQYCLIPSLRWHSSLIPWWILKPNRCEWISYFSYTSFLNIFNAIGNRLIEFCIHDDFCAFLWNTKWP